MRFFLCVLSAAVPCTAAAGQTALFVQPSSFEVAPGEELKLGLAGGAPGGGAQPSPWPAEVAWLLVRSGGAQDNRDRVEPVGEDAAAFVPWTLTSPGCALIGVDFKPVMLSLTPEQLAALPGGPAAQPGAGALRVRHERSAKALIRVRGDQVMRDGATAVSKSGQRVEIRPFADPTLTPAGGDVPLRMYIGGDAVGPCSVRATHVATAQVHSYQGEGTLLLPLPAAGVWRVEFHHARPARGDPDADWVLYSATLVFEVPGEAAR